MTFPSGFHRHLIIMFFSWVGMLLATQLPNFKEVVFKQFCLRARSMENYFNITGGFVLLLVLSFSAVGLIYRRSVKSGLSEELMPRTVTLYPWKETPVYGFISKRKKVL